MFGVGRKEFHILGTVGDARHFPLPEHFLQDGVVAVGESDAIVRLEPVVQQALRVFHPFKTAEPFQMGLSHIGDEAVGGLGHRQQRFQVFGMAGAHLDDGQLGIGPDLEDGQRMLMFLSQKILRQ